MVALLQLRGICLRVSGYEDGETAMQFPVCDADRDGDPGDSGRVFGLCAGAEGASFSEADFRLYHGHHDDPRGFDTDLHLPVKQADALAEFLSGTDSERSDFRIQHPDDAELF